MVSAHDSEGAADEAVEGMATKENRSSGYIIFLSQFTAVWCDSVAKYDNSGDADHAMLSQEVYCFQWVSQILPERTSLA